MNASIHITHKDDHLQVSYGVAAGAVVAWLREHGTPEGERWRLDPQREPELASLARQHYAYGYSYHGSNVQVLWTPAAMEPQPMSAPTELARYGEQLAFL